MVHTLLELITPKISTYHNSHKCASDTPLIHEGGTQAYITDRSKATLLLWFQLCYVLVLIFVLFAAYVRFQILVKFG